MRHKVVCAGLIICFIFLQMIVVSITEPSYQLFVLGILIISSICQPKHGLMAMLVFFVVLPFFLKGNSRDIINYSLFIVISIFVISLIRNQFKLTLSIEKAIKERTEELEQALETLRTNQRIYYAIGESIDYGVWVCEADGKNIYASKSFLDLVGITQQQCSNFGWGDLLYPDDVENTISAWQECVRTEGTWDIEHRFKGADGNWHPILARGVPVRDDNGKLIYWTGINLDISKIKSVQNELKLLNATLEEKVKDRSAALEMRLIEKKILLEELEQQHRHKDNFLAALAHEMRGPLGVINNNTQIINILTNGNEKAKESVTAIKRNSEVLVRLITDLYDLSVIGQSKMTLQKKNIDLSDIIKRAIQVVKPELNKRSHTLEVDISPIFIDADPVRLQQIVSNLLMNAIKYTENYGKIKIVSKICYPNINIIVSDTGIGISKELKSKIFDVFVQENRKQEVGMGIGLSLVKGLVELHGGTIDLESVLGKGSTFTVTLPATY